MSEVEAHTVDTRATTKAISDWKGELSSTYTRAGLRHVEPDGLAAWDKVAEISSWLDVGQVLKRMWACLQDEKPERGIGSGESTRSYSCSGAP